MLAASLFGSALRPWIRRKHDQDLQGAVPRSGVATVEVRYGAGPHQEGDAPRPWALVRFNGKLYPTKTAAGIQQLREGEPAAISYRVGKSGKIYVDSVQPLPKSP